MLLVKPTMIGMLSKDTRLCISLSARPSNNGTRFHNFLYAQLGLDYVYKAFAPCDIEAAVAGVRGLGIRGAAVSMPYKEAVIPLVDALAPSAAAIHSVNTIVNDDGVLTAYNTDYSAVAQLIERLGRPTSAPVLVQGSGGMAKAVVAAFADAGFEDVTVAARTESRGRALAEQYGARWVPSPEPGAEIAVNATPLGMDGGPEAETLAFPEPVIEAAGAVFDVVALPAETPLVMAARERGKDVATGAEVAVLQALEQFVLYTGVRPSPEQVAEAAEYMRTGAAPADRA